MEAEIQAWRYNAQLNRPPLLTYRNQTYAVYSEREVMVLQEKTPMKAEEAHYSSSKVAFIDRSLRVI